MIRGLQSQVQCHNHCATELTARWVKQRRNWI